MKKFEKKKIFISGDIFGSYRASLTIKNLIDMKHEVSLMPPSFWKSKNILVRYIGELIFLLLKIIIIIRSEIIYVLPMNLNRDQVIDLFLAKIFRKKFIVDFYMSKYEGYVFDHKKLNVKSGSAKLLFYMEKNLLRHADKVIFLNETERNYYKSVLKEEKLSNDFILPIVIDDKSEITKQLSFDEENKRKICWWGSSLPLHGLNELLVKLKNSQIKNYEIEFFFPKNEPIPKNLMQLIKGSNIKLRNDLSFGDNSLPVYLYKNCVLALGIFGETEKTKNVIPNKIIDAISLYLPVLTKKTNAIEQYFTDNENILLVDRNESLNHKIEKFLEDKEKIAKIKSNAYKIYGKNFSSKCFKEKLQEIINK